MVRTYRQPCPAVSREEQIGFLRPGSSAGIIRETRSRPPRPGFDQFLYSIPRCLNGIGALEKRRVAEQTIVDQRLIPDSRKRIEIVAIREVHCHALDLDVGARPLCAE